MFSLIPFFFHAVELGYEYFLSQKASAALSGLRNSRDISSLEQFIFVITYSFETRRDIYAFFFAYDLDTPEAFVSPRFSRRVPVDHTIVASMI